MKDSNVPDVGRASGCAPPGGRQAATRAAVAKVPCGTVLRKLQIDEQATAREPLACARESTDGAVGHVEFGGDGRLWRGGRRGQPEYRGLSGS